MKWMDLSGAHSSLWIPFGGFSMSRRIASTSAAVACVAASPLTSTGANAQELDASAATHKRRWMRRIDLTRSRWENPALKDGIILSITAGFRAESFQTG